MLHLNHPTLADPVGRILSFLKLVNAHLSSSCARVFGWLQSKVWLKEEGDANHLCINN